MFTIDIQDARLKQSNYLREAENYRLIKSLGGIKSPTARFTGAFRVLVTQLLSH